MFSRKHGERPLRKVVLSYLVWLLDANSSAVMAGRNVTMTSGYCSTQLIYVTNRKERDTKHHSVAFRQETSGIFVYILRSLSDEIQSLAGWTLNLCIHTLQTVYDWRKRCIDRTLEKLERNGTKNQRRSLTRDSRHLCTFWIR
jgi:hypothetical protein